MSRVAVWGIGLMLTLPAVAPAQCPSEDARKLVCLIPNLYGPNGLRVASEAPLPNGQTHSAHFNSGFQSEFTQLNIALASQLATVPLPSLASGFTYTFDAETGVFTRSTQSYGPIFSDRAETVGKKKFSFGFNFQRYTFDSIEGVPLNRVNAVFTHDDPAPGGKADVVTTANNLDIELQQFTGFFTYGLTSRVDLSLAVPIVHTRLDVTSVATIRRLGTTDPKVHFFPDANGGFGDTATFHSQGDATGIGDVVFRAKARVLSRGNLGAAVGLDVRAPTGDEMDLLGSGAVGVKPFGALSWSRKTVSPHVNLAYGWNGKSTLAGNPTTGEKRDLPDQFVWSAGADWGVTKQFTIVFDVLGQRLSKSPRLVSETFQGLDAAHTTFGNISFKDDTQNQTNGSLGFKLNVIGKMLFDANLLMKLDDAGLRDRLTPLVGFEYSH